MEELLSKFMAESVKRHEENSNLIKEIRASTDAAIRNQGSSIKALEIQIGKISKVLQERGSRSLPSSTKTNPRDYVKSILTTVETNTTLIRHIPFPSHFYDDCCDKEEGSYELKELDAYSIGTTLLDYALPTKKIDLGSFTLPCIINNLCFNKALDDLEASVSVMPFSTYTKLGLGELAPTKLIVDLAGRIVKHPKGIAKNVLVGIDKFVFLVDFIVLDMPEDIKTPLILGRPFLSTAHAKINVLRERMELDLEARLMEEALILNRSLDLLYGDYIELNDLNEPLEIRRNQVDDLEPTIEEGEVVDEPMMDIVKTRYDNEIIDGLDEYPSYCDFDWKIHIECAYNLKFSCMIGYEYVSANFFFVLSINVMSKIFYNSIMKDKILQLWKIVVENRDSYSDDGMGDVIVGRPFCIEAFVKARRFDGKITIYKGDDSVIYQMARFHPRFNHLTNA
ncbi:ribonuclease H-like domain, reverse transcriptase, RNA-dependent DNA polymerase [Tanacetum coccineum]